jgi:hypothetical protein
VKYEIGDTVLVLHTGEEGRVVDIVSEQMVMIEVDGVRFPVYNDQIDFPYFQMFSNPKPAEKKKTYIDQLPVEKHPLKSDSEPGVFLSFVPVYDKDLFDDEVVSQFKLYLVNHTGNGYSFSYTCQAGTLSGYRIENALPAHSDFYLHDLPFAEAADNPPFFFEFRLSEPDKRKAPYYESLFRLRSKALHRKMEEMRAAGTALFRFLLFEKYPDEVAAAKPEKMPPIMGKAPVYRLEEAGRFLEKPQPVIDLHIEKLTDSWSHLSGGEMLALQLRTFERQYELALVHYQSTLTVIHGVGSGRLKEEIHRLLRGRKEVKGFSDAYSPLYGYGATVIQFYY